MSASTAQARSAPHARAAASSASSDASDASRSRSTGTAVPSGSATTADSGAACEPLTPSLRTQIESRGLDVAMLERLGVGACKRLGADWIAIPYVWDGQRVNTKYRTIGGEKRFSQDKGGKQILWNVDCLADASLINEPLIITEGELDAMVALQCGFPRTVSVPGGAPSQALGEGAGAAGKYAFLDAAHPALGDVQQIVLAVDGDGPGAALLADLALHLGKARCRWLRYPPGTKDLNDVLVQHGAEAVRALIERAPWYPLEGIYRLGDLPPPDIEPAVPIGIVGLDKHYQARRGDLVVVTGIPGHGKSSLVNEICCRLAWRHGWNTCFASFEQAPKLDHCRALRSFHARKAEAAMSLPELAAADDWIDKRFCFLVAHDEEHVDLAWVLERAAAAVRRFDVHVLVIDPWNEMDHVRPPGMSLTEYTGYAIKQFKKFARRHRVHLIVVAHPAKLQRIHGSGKYPVPTLYDIADSANWANKPDIGLVVHREDLGPDGTTTIKIPKVRYVGEIGMPGEVTGLRWNREVTRYERKESIDA